MPERERRADAGSTALVMDAGRSSGRCEQPLDPVTSLALDEGWIRAVLFDHAIDDWVDLGPDPIRRRHVGQIYADHVGAAYGAWKWVCDRAGTDIDEPPAARPAPEALALEVGVTNWTELMAALLTVGRAQSLLFAELASTGDDARRAFDRVGRDYAGHAALAYLEFRRGTFIDRALAETALSTMLPATRALLTGTGLDEGFDARLQPLLESLELGRPGMGQGPHALEEPGVGAPGGAAKPQR